MQREAEKEYAGEYEIVQSMEIGSERLVLGRNDNLPKPFLVANHRTKLDGLFSEYFEVGVSDEYMEILGEYLQRQQKAYATLVQQREARGSDGTVFGAADCLPEPQKQRYVGQVVVMAPTSLAPEFRTKDNQLLYVVGGNGAEPNSRGTKVFVRDCWSGERFYVRRSDVIGILQPEKLPNWAKENAHIFSYLQKQPPQHSEELEV